MNSAPSGPNSLDRWVARLSEVDLPVLRSTARQLASISTEAGEAVRLQELAQIVLLDPLMTAKLYVHMKRVTGENHSLAEITTVDRMILMLGVPPFLEAFRSPPQVEDALRGNLPALRGLIEVVQRARRASEIAGAFAVFRNDLSFEEIMVSAMLHDLAEMLVWLYAPHLALEMRHRLAANPRLRSAAVQKAVMGIGLNELQLALARHWRLPGLLVTMMSDGRADNPSVRSVMLAVNIARHSMSGWNNPALPDDFMEAAALFSTTPAHVIELVRPEGAQVEPNAPVGIEPA